MNIQFETVFEQGDASSSADNLRPFLGSGNIQKIYSTPHYIVLVVRLPGASRYIYIGRGGKYKGIISGKRLASPDFRGVDRFLEFLRRNLRGGRIEKILFDPLDNILAIHYFKMQKEQHIHFFWKGDSLYFTHFDGEFQFISWQGGRLPATEFDAIRVFEQVGRKEQKNSLVERIFSEDIVESYLNELSGFLAGEGEKKKKVKSLKRKVGNISNDLARVRKCTEIKKLLVEDTLTLDGGRFEYQRVKIKYPRDVSDHFKKRDYLFKKMKDYERAQLFLCKRLRETEEQLAKYLLSENKEIDFLKLVVSPIWGTRGEIAKKSGEVSREYGEFKTLTGKRVAIASNAQGNDYLRINWAKKEDLWMHLDGYKSGHLFVKTENITQLGQEELSSLVGLLAEKSHFGPEKVPVLFTKVKFLKGVKGAPGKVTYKKEKHLIITQDKGWRKNIFQA